MTKLSEARKNMMSYMMNRIDFSDYDEVEFPNLKSIIVAEKAGKPFDVNTVEDWLRGVPSSMHTEWTDLGAVITLRKCGFTDDTEPTTKLADKYWRELARAVYRYALATSDEIRLKGVLTGLQHIGCSRWGNPKYQFVVAGRIIETPTDSGHGYGISNFYKKLVTLVATHKKGKLILDEIKEVK